MTFSHIEPGTLFIVATPIGNLQDVSERCKTILGQVDLILAEDTRHAGKLLSHYQITTPTSSFHEHNEQHQVAKVIKQLRLGNNLALISDAGTPLISDPGYRLVHECVIHQIPISPIPGPCAIPVALCVSGLATDRFCFEGFLPAKPNARRSRLSELTDESRTLVFYESSHRITDTIDAIRVEFGDHRTLCIGREMTKKFESFYYGSPSHVLTQLQQNSVNQKGEFVIVMSGATEDNQPELNRALALLDRLTPHLPLKQACTIVAATFDCNRNLLYQAGLAAKADAEGDCN